MNDSTNTNETVEDQNLAPIPGDATPEAGWEKVLVVAGAPKTMPSKAGRKVIVAENRRALKDGETDSADGGAKYPKGADAYVGYAAVAGDMAANTAQTFGDSADGAEVVMMGDNVRQAGHGGLSRKVGWLAVGPSHPVYIAVNLAAQKGAKDVKIVGLREDEVATLRPWFEEISPNFEKLEYGG